MRQRSMRGNLYLVGFMAAGKTTIGQMIGRELHREFIDLDRRIEQREGRPVAEIFRRDGEAAFRRIEREMLREVSTLDNAVIALGGGSYIDPTNRAIARATGVTVFLDAPMGAIVDRLGSHADRPLAHGTPADLERLLQLRMSSYREAEICIPAGGTPAQVLDAVLHALAITEPAR